VSVAKDWEDLWLGVKGLSNVVIAGFLRNLCKWSILVDSFRGKVRDEWFSDLISTQLRILKLLTGNKTVSAKVHCRKGNSPAL